MTKRLGFLLVALLIVPMLLTACGSDSPDKAEDYMNAVFEGKVEDAQALACDEAFAAKTAELIAAYASRYDGMMIDPEKIDLKYDIGKGMNDKEVIVTGAIVFVLANQATDTEAAQDIEIEYELSNNDETRIVLIMEKDGDDWCVSGDSTFGIIEEKTAE